MNNTYKTLKTDLKSPKALEALERIKEAIDFYKEFNVQFNLSSIGRYCEDKWESPKTQSIRNNKKFVDYIKEEQKEMKKKDISIVSKKNKNVDNFILNKVEDEETKEYIKIQQEKYKLLEEKYNTLKQSFNDFKNIDIDNLIDKNLNPKKPQDLNGLKNMITNSKPLDNDIGELIEDNIMGLLSVDENTDKEIDKYIGNLQKDKNSVKLVEEIKILDLIEILNNDFLSKIDIKLGYKNGVVFNLNTGNIVFELNK